MDAIEGKVLQKIDSHVWENWICKYISAVTVFASPIKNTAVTNEARTMLYLHNQAIAFSLHCSIGPRTRNLPTRYAFPSIGLPSLIVFWFCGDSPKWINPFWLILSKDCKNDAQKCLYLGNVMRCQELIEAMEWMFLYHGVGHLLHHEECSYSLYWTYATKHKGRISWDLMVSIPSLGLGEHAVKRTVGEVKVAKGHLEWVIGTCTILCRWVLSKEFLKSTIFFYLCLVWPLREHLKMFSL